MDTFIWTILCPVIYALTNYTFCWHSISIKGISAMRVCRTFWCWSLVLLYSIWVRRVTIWIGISVDWIVVCFFCYGTDFLFKYTRCGMTLPEFFVLFYKYIFLVWISSFIAKVVLYMVHWLLLDVKLFKICSGDLIVFQKYFDQVGFNNIII